ncbi:hypothetical protein STEG23_024826, partial [Scotinomys teguina]
ASPEFDTEPIITALSIKTVFRPLRDSESVSPGQDLETAFNRHPGVVDTSVPKVNSGAFEYLGNRVSFKTGEKNMEIMRGSTKARHGYGWDWMVFKLTQLWDKNQSTSPRPVYERKEIENTSMYDDKNQAQKDVDQGMSFLMPNGEVPGVAVASVLGLVTTVL